MGTFQQALTLRSNQSLRDSLDIDEFDIGKDSKSIKTKRDSTWANVHLHCQVQLLTEMMRRIWDQFEGHSNRCKHPALTTDCPYLDYESEDGWQTINEQEFLKSLEGIKMDKQIKKVEKDVKKGKKMKAVKDIKVLKKMDKKFDKKIVKAKKVMKKGC